MLARDLRFGIVGGEIHFRKRAGLGIPSADQIVAVFEREFLALASTANYGQLRLERRTGRGRGRGLALGCGFRFDLAGWRFRLRYFGGGSFIARSFWARCFRCGRGSRVGAFGGGRGGWSCFGSRGGTAACGREPRAAFVGGVSAAHVFVTP